MKAEFWKQLTAYKAKTVFNPWAQRDELDVTGPQGGPEARLRRLARAFDVPAVKYVLVGEAPGHRGCHFTGVPFTCEYDLVDGRYPFCAHGAGDSNRITKSPDPWLEQTAKNVWNVLHNLGISGETVSWNAFPWHPFDLKYPRSNRTPTPAELHQGLPLLAMVLQEYSARANIIAVGNQAEKLLRALGFNIEGDQNYLKVRHPSYGGQQQFFEDMQHIVQVQRGSALR